MPKIHFIGNPRDLYRYKTFLEVLIDKKQDWGVSLDYNSNNSDLKKRNLLSRKIRSLMRVGMSALSIWQADFVYVPPMVLGLDFSSKILIAITNILKKKVIFDYYISIYDTMVLDRKLIEADSKDAVKLSKLDKWGHTRLISIYLNPCEAKRYRALNGLGEDKNVRIIPLSIGARPYAELKYYRAKERTCFNMVWWGTYIPLHGLDKIIEATRILVKRGFNVHLFILGNNEELAKGYQKLVDEEEGLASYITIANDITFSNGKMLPFLHENCDLAFGAFGDSEKAKTVILNKAIEAVAMKIPVLTQYSEAFEYYFPKESTLFYCKNEPMLMADRINEIMKMPVAELDERLDASWQIYDKYFSIEASKQMFGELLEELKD